MMTSISFGTSLLDPRNAALREKISSLAYSSLLRPLRADTLIGFDAEWVSSLQAQSRRWFLLFDTHRLFLYDFAATATSPRIDWVVRSILDNYPFSRFELLADRISRSHYTFLYDLDSLDLLKILFSYDHPGQISVLDFVRSEVRAIKPPSIVPSDMPRGEELVTRSKPPLRPPGPAIVFCDREVGPGLRGSSPPPLDEFVSEEVGTIRAERIVIKDLPVPSAVTRMAWNNGNREMICGAKAFAVSQALAIARCESIERFQIIYAKPGEELIYGSYSELMDLAIDPKRLIYRLAGPGAEAAYERYVKYEETTPMYWTWASEARSGQACLVPAQEVWFNTSRLKGERVCVATTTNGCAVGGSIEEATLFAIMEAIERDAYLTMWYLRRKCEKVAPETVKGERFRLLWEKISRELPNYSIGFYDISTDVEIPTIAAIAVRQQGEGPRTIHAAAARLDVERAMLSALIDLSAEMAIGRSPRNWLASEPALVDMPEDHRDLYALDETFDRLSFIELGRQATLSVDEINRRSPIPAQQSYNLREVLLKIVDHLESAGVEVLLKNMTHPVFEAKQLHCIRAITPGLLPLWFGYYSVRFAITERLERLAERYAGNRISGDEDVNLELHPFP